MGCTGRAMIASRMSNLTPCAAVAFAARLAGLIAVHHQHLGLGIRIRCHHPNNQILRAEFDQER